MKRNIDRFPEDFMIRLTKREKEYVVANCDHLKSLKFSPYLPFAFTEYGAVMAANVLNSSIAIKLSVEVVRAFVKLKEVFSNNKELGEKIDDLEQSLRYRLDGHDDSIHLLFEVIKI